MRSLLVAVPLAALLSALPIARAQEPTADELIEHGIALREDGRDGEALEVFHRAYDTTPSAQAMAQIALAEQALGRLVDAETHLDAALALPADRFLRRNRALLEQALAEIRTQLTDLTLTGGVDGAEVLVDGVSRGTMPLSGTLRVQAGTAHLEIRAEGYEPYAREVIVNAGAPVSLAVALDRVPSPPEPVVVAEPEPEPAPPPPPAATESDWMLPTGIALAAAGVIGLGVASGLMAWREDNARARLFCSDVDPECRARYGTAVDAETAGIATFVVSGLFAVGGAVLVVLDLLGAHHDRSSASLSCAPGLLSWSCAGRF